MSAIFGKVLTEENGIVDRDALEGISKAYSLYQVERVDTLAEKNAEFGCALQCFRAEAEREVLPYFDSDRSVMYTADCVIDNRAELKALLGLEDGTPDGSIMYAAYLKWGEECFAHLRGPYSFALYDFAKQELLLAVDQFAQRCLFYHIRDGKVYFSTLLLPLIKETGLLFEENERWLLDAISLRSPAIVTEPRETAVKDVFKVVSGTYIKIGKNQTAPVEVRYYDPGATIKTNKKMTLGESEKLIREVMEKSVADILDTDVEIAVQLSAGLDSTTVACLAAPMLEKRGKLLRSYTSVPLKEAKLPDKGYLVYDETAGVMKVCEAYKNIKPSFLAVENRTYLKEVEGILHTWELPCKSEQNSVWVDEICKQARADGNRIILTGATGNCTLSAGSMDDVLISYIKHFRFGKAKRMLDGVSSLGASRKRYLKAVLKNIKNYYSWYFDSEERNTYRLNVTIPEAGEKYYLNKRFNKELLHFYPFANQKEYRRQMYILNANAQIGEIDTKNSLACGVMPRDPMRNPEVVNACFTIPMECLASYDYDRRLVREGMRGIVPEEIRHDIRHRGRQSGDNEYRIAQVWEEMLPEIRKSLNSERTLKYLSKDRIEENIGAVSVDEKENDVMAMRMIVDAYTFSKYLEMLFD